MIAQVAAMPAPVLMSIIDWINCTNGPMIGAASTLMTLLTA